MTKKRIIMSIVAAVLVVAMILGLAFWNRNGGKVEVFPVSTVMMDAAFFGEEYGLSGSITDGATQTVNLKDALVEEIYVASGDAVKQGDVLMQYDVRSYALTIQADEANVAVKEAAILTAKDELAKYQSLQPSEAAPDYGYDDDEPEEETIDHGELQTVAKVSTPSGDLNYNCTVDTVVTADFLKTIRDQKLTATFNVYQDDILYGSWVVHGASLPATAEDVYTAYELPDISVQADENWIPAEIETTVDIPDETPVVEDPENPGEGEQPAASTRQVTVTVPIDRAGITAQINESISEKIEESLSQLPDLYTQTAGEEAITEDWGLGTGLEITDEGASVDPQKATYGVFSACAPTEYERYEVIEADFDEVDYDTYDYGSDDENYMYSRSELNDLIKEKQEEIEAAELEVKQAKLQLEQDKLVAETGQVVAKFDGVVTVVRDPEEIQTGQVILRVKGTDSFEVTTYIDELTLQDVKIGDMLNVYSYESGNTFTATITEISDRPAEGSYYSGSANPNSSYYPVKASIDDSDLELTVGESCGASLITDQTSSSIYLEQAYVRSDEGGSYVMVASDTDKLEKRYVETGGLLWGWLIEVKGNHLSAEDRIAVPYGKNVKEGVSVVDVDGPSYDY